MTATAPAYRQVRRWDEAAIRAGLTEFLQGWNVWPTFEEFARGGAKGLREAIARIHGPEWWAKEMNLPGGDRSPGGVQRWTEDTIRATLREFLVRRTTWPTNREFDDAGLHAFREALRHYGGPRRWSAEMGVDWTPRRAVHQRARDRGRPTRSNATAGRWPKWNAQTIEAELRTILAGSTEWPRWDQFVDSGRKGLYQAVLKHGGARLWADRMGVTVPDRGRWSRERVESELRQFCRGLSTWPSSAEFDAAGKGGLRHAAARHGGIRFWQEHLELHAPTSS